MKIGDARVSTADHAFVLQQDARKAAGRTRIFTDDGVCTVRRGRRGLDKALATLFRGDTLIAWKLGRLGRSLSHLEHLIADLGVVTFQSLSDPIETTSLRARPVLHIMGALVESERALILDRAQAGTRTTRKRGVHLGRRINRKPEQVAHARA
jgi:DNA invertase Pin-like site-specific DNA recombinase